MEMLCIYAVQYGNHYLCAAQITWNVARWLKNQSFNFI